MLLIRDDESSNERAPGEYDAMTRTNLHRQSVESCDLPPHGNERDVVCVSLRRYAGVRSCHFEAPMRGGMLVCRYDSMASCLPPPFSDGA